MTKLVLRKNIKQLFLHIRVHGVPFLFCEVLSNQTFNARPRDNFCRTFLTSAKVAWSSCLIG